MEVSNELIRECTRRLMLSRMRLLCDNGFYGLLLMHAKLGIGDKHETAWTEAGERITFNPKFMKSLSDSELDYVMMHEILHIVLNHLARLKVIGKDTFIFNIAADIVVDSNILRSCGGNEQAISLSAYGGVQEHKALDGTEGWTHTVEELYEMLLVEIKEGEDSESSGWDVHVYEDGDDAGDDEQTVSENKAKQEFWNACVMQAIEAMAARRVLSDGISCGSIPAFAERYMEELRNPQTDWRTVLDEFVQEDTVDYSFTPPDRRFDDSPFFLPDFNEKDEWVEKILFMIDTSGSMSDESVTTVYAEIKGAIEQFNGKIEGWLGFFDAEVVEPKAFADEDAFLIIRPKGGGGTSFKAIFKYVEEYMSDEDIVSIVILTDGYADFPEERDAHGIPVLWIITNEKVTPPWGKVARIKVDT